MRATVLYGAGDVRVENVPDPVIKKPTDAIVRVLRAAVCGSDLHPYRSAPAGLQGRQMGHEAASNPAASSTRPSPSTTPPTPTGPWPTAAS